MPPIRLIATDLDGTLIGTGRDAVFYNRLRDVVHELRSRHDAMWVICTGRTKKGFRAVFRGMAQFGLWPDYVILRHAYVYGYSPLFWAPHWGWNLRVRAVQNRQRRALRRALPELENLALLAFDKASTVHRNHGKLELRFSTADEALAAARMLRERVKTFRYLHVSQTGTRVRLITVPFTKGLSLQQLARLLDVSAAETLAIGDGHNDISMVDPAIAGMTGCPANAHPDVLEAVHEAGGHISALTSVAGVLDIIEAHMSGEVRSALPVDWQQADKRPTPDDDGRASPHPRRKTPRDTSLRRGILFLVTIGAILLLVMANFGLLPGGRLIMRPFEKAMAILVRLVDAVTRAVR